MIIKINDCGFNQAKALLNDAIFKLQFKGSTPQEFKCYKLLKARIENPDFETRLAEFICGEESNSFPYRSSYYLTKFFQELGFDYIHNGTTRRFWVREVLYELGIIEILQIIEKGLFNKRDFKIEAREKGLNFEDRYQTALREFKEFIDESYEINSGLDLSYLLDLNVNVELLIDRPVQTDDEELNKLVKEAKERFFNPKDKQIAIEKLWDAFERVKTYYSGNKKQSTEKLIALISKEFDLTFLENEFQILTEIGNSYRIRHHETNKKEIANSKHMTYLFFRMLSLLDLCLTSINNKRQLS